MVQPYDGKFAWAAKNYVSPKVAQISLSNSSRLDQIIRAGRIYLSLQDAIALALENNLDIEISRYNMPIAQSDVLRAEAGGLLRGVPSAIQQGANSAVNLQTGAERRHWRGEQRQFEFILQRGRWNDHHLHGFGHPELRPHHVPVLQLGP